MRLNSRHFLFFAALALLGVFLVDSHSTFAQSRRRVVGTDDAAPVMKLFEGRSTTDTLQALSAVRIPAFSVEDRADILNNTSPRFRRSIITDEARVAALKQRLKPVLALHGREGKLEIIVYDDDVPETQSVPGAFIAFSTGLLDLARSDGELQGVAARELAREYFTLPSAYARYTEDHALARQQERNLDAVTVATLLELKLNPAEYKALLRRIYERTPLDVGDDERAAIETAFAARLDAFNRLEVALKKPNKGKGRGNAG
ncbi:MAG TPA: hypothetical protein VFS10_17740 [Pyrinomonadaceae bacterium]|nr:hypothetical protein [Pyrinomonadaceae bacterium]